MKTYYSYLIKPSVKKNKKYDVFKKNKYVLSFGDNRYQQFFDKIGHYKNLNHNDNKRKDLYYKRHSKDYPKYTSDWFSKKYLW
jgi:hypothetical protein